MHRLAAALSIAAVMLAALPAPVNAYYYTTCAAGSYTFIAFVERTGSTYDASRGTTVVRNLNSCTGSGIGKSFVLPGNIGGPHRLVQIGYGRLAPGRRLRSSTPTAIRTRACVLGFNWVL